MRRLYHHLSLAWGFLIWLVPVALAAVVGYYLIRLLRWSWEQQ
jgi:hypothetical protein